MGFLLGAFGKLSAGGRLRQLQARMIASSLELDGLLVMWPKWRR